MGPLHVSQHDKKKPKHRRRKKQFLKAQALTRVCWENEKSIDESGKTRVYKMIKEWEFLKGNNIQSNEPILSVYGVNDTIPKEISSNTIIVTKEGMVEMALLKSVLPPSLLEECTQLCREMSEWLATEKDIDKGSFFSGWWTMNMPMGYKCADSFRFELVDTKVKQIQALLHDTFQHILELANPKLFAKLSKLTERGQTPVVCFNMIPTRNESVKEKFQGSYKSTDKVNRPKTNHRDRNDMGISAMFYMGKFGGGSLQLIRVNEHTPKTLVHIQAGDVVLLRANKYRHAVSPTRPQSFPLANSSQTEVDDVKICENSSPTLNNPQADDNTPTLINTCPKQEPTDGDNPVQSSKEPSNDYEQKRFSFIFFAHRSHFKHSKVYCGMGQRQALNAFKADHPYYQSQRMKKKLGDDCLDQSLILTEKRKPIKRNYALFNECGDDKQEESDEEEYQQYEPKPTTEEYTIKVIVDHEKVFKGSDQSRKSYLYHIQWLGYPDETWEPYEHLDDCQVFEDYLKHHNISLFDEEEEDRKVDDSMLLPAWMHEDESLFEALLPIICCSTDNPRHHLDDVPPFDFNY
ncbi:predicted protein [Naegleria gruberi]|uniref:Predicted protein n=1 Tax=Naegleria gruberi TaxID=5762 RepID=D2V161_NAEGR|nr:uncharacterized protein NAEGRDRAFT_46005 [Naegleria gruberi]EFC49410.1 predicted protein [Naegleria gruberi]|eukprot:XP_002682154.1 predicted protein [Naegleria gruberi strain NEG-M]